MLRRGTAQSFSLNSVEPAGLLGRLQEAGHTTWSVPKNYAESDAQQPRFVFDAAEALLEPQGLDRVHVHGHSDFIVQRNVSDPERVVLAAMRARQLGSMRATNASGEIREAKDIWPVAPVVEADGLVKLQAIADDMQRRFGLSQGNAKTLLNAGITPTTTCPTSSCRVGASTIPRVVPSASGTPWMP